MKNVESIGCADECVKFEEKNEESIGCADECAKNEKSYSEVIILESENEIDS
ncbi:MAG: hypothetical protein J6B47_05430 [Prevotella sp.]|nr:hypothetical protein [Prevotella sp.]